MFKPEVDVIILSSQRPERLNNLMCQVATALLSYAGSRVTVVVGGKVMPALLESFPAQERIRYIEDAPKGFSGYAALNHALEKLDLAPWWCFAGDDDCMMPWALEQMMQHASLDSGLIIAPTLSVSKDKHYDKTHYKVGEQILRNHVGNNNILVNTASMKQLPKPWFKVEAGTNDYYFIEQMATMFPVRMIPNVVGVLALGGL